MLAALKVLAYLIPIVGLVVSGAVHPLALSSWHDAVTPLVSVAATWFALRVHPNGVYGPAAGVTPPRSVQGRPSGEVRLGVLWSIVAASFLAYFAVSLFPGCATLAKGTTCLSSTAYVPIGGTGVECSGACVGDTGVQVSCRPVGSATAGAALTVPRVAP